MIRSILGPNSFMAHQRLVELLNGIDVSSVERFSGDNLDVKSLRESLQAQSLFTNPTVVLSNVSEQKSLHEDIIQIIESAPEGCELIIYEPNIDKRSKYYKFLLKHTVCDEFKALDGNELAIWIVEQAQKNNGEIDRQTAWYLVERVGEDQWLLSNELNKLILSSSKIDKKLIDELVEPTPNESIFKLLDLISAGNTKGATEQYDKLIEQRLDPNYIMSMLVWQLNILAILVSAGSRTPEEVAKQAKISPFVAKKTAQVAKNTTKNRLVNMLEATAKLDADLKSKPIDAVEALKVLVVKLSSK